MKAKIVIDLHEFFDEYSSNDFLCFDLARFVTTKLMSQGVFLHPKAFSESVNHTMHRLLMESFPNENVDLEIRGKSIVAYYLRHMDFIGCDPSSYDYGLPGAAIRSDFVEKVRARPGSRFVMLEYSYDDEAVSSS